MRALKICEILRPRIHPATERIELGKTCRLHWAFPHHSLLNNTRQRHRMHIAGIIGNLEMWEDACSSCDTVPEKNQCREGSVYLDSHGEGVTLIGAWVGGGLCSQKAVWWKLARGWIILLIQRCPQWVYAPQLTQSLGDLSRRFWHQTGK